MTPDEQHELPMLKVFSQTLLRYSIAVLLMGATTSTIVLGLIAPEQPVRLFGPALVALVAMIGWYLLARERVEGAVRFLAFGAWAAVTLISIATGGVQAPVVIAYPMIILLVGWVIGTRAVIVLTGLSVSMAFGFVWAEWVGLLPKPFPSSSALHSIDQALVYVFSAVLVVFLVRAYQARLAELSGVTDVLADRSRDLQTSQAELVRAQSVAKVGSWVGDLAAGDMRISTETARIFDLPEGTRGTYENYLARTHPDDRDAVEQAWGAALNGGPFDFEHRILVGESVRWVRQKAELTFSKRGALRGIVGITQDITERKESDERLRLAASVFTYAHEGILITTADGAIIDVNEAFSRITGYSRDEVLGRNPRILSSGRQGRAFYAEMWRKLLEDGHWYGEVWNRRKNGEVFAEMQTISTVRDAQGRVQHYVALFSDISAIKAHQSHLEHIAHYDTLTNLPNRALLADRLHQAMAQTQRHGQRLAVAYLDLDGFKAINDRHGHDAGDHLLIVVAARMKSALREGDSLARLGGDEFVAVLLDLADVDASVPMLRRLLGAAAEPVQFGDLVLQVSASLGVTFYPQNDEVDADQLLRQADQAMYQAKLAGKNRYHFFDAEQDRSIRGYHESLDRIRQAMLEHEFVLHYQPKVNMRTGQVVGAEALIRWQHPQKGLLLPTAFLSVIENHPLAIEVGEWVLDTALRQIAQWRANGLDLHVSVNIGAHQLQRPDFVERLRALLARHPQIRAGDLELEILETSALEELVHVSRVIEECRAIGVSFALDDFGTGYSSLTYLKRLAVKQLKIDQSFVRDMLDDPDDLAILEGVISLANAFHREVIAEGVETLAHGQVLLQLGCELAQGFGIARPMLGDAMVQWAANWQIDSPWGTDASALEAANI